MQLSKETLVLIKNFASINGSLMLKEGNALATISEGKNVMAQATITETLPGDFGIYDLNEFLGALSIFENADLQFKEKYILISDGNKANIKYFGAGEGIVKAAPSTIKFPTPDVVFTLTADQIQMIMKTSGALKAADVTIAGDGTTLQVIVSDKKNATSNAYQVDIDTTDQIFKANFKVENLKMLPGEYLVEISSKKISKFTNTSMPLNYFIAIEADSTFE